jgi:hypothetical protein
MLVAALAMTGAGEQAQAAANRLFRHGSEVSTDRHSTADAAHHLRRTRSNNRLRGHK